MDDTLSLSALQHYAYCPRQFALIHVEQAWSENRFTAEGRLLHQRVDSGVAEQRPGIRFERGVWLQSQQHRLTGMLDLLEVATGDPPTFFPVEYKRGKPKLEDWDRIQLCAQALCLEEMRGVRVAEGAIWYWEVRHRQPVALDATLRSATLTAIENAHSVLDAGRTPAPTMQEKRCRACSLIDLCEPSSFRRDRSAAYLEALFSL